jgi:hypothetical protein
MYIDKLKSWFLLAFVVLFWNLGPSMHHVDFLGLHSSILGSSPHCSCCCSHSVPVDSDDESTKLVEQHKQPGHCWLCDFFDQFHLMIENGTDSHELQFVVFVEPQSEKICDYESVSAQARGPPRA